MVERLEVEEAPAMELRQKGEERFSLLLCSLCFKFEFVFGSGFVLLYSCVDV